MKTIIYNIGTLAGILAADVRKLEGTQMNHVECIEDAYLVIEDGIITEYGEMSDSVILKGESQSSQRGNSPVILNGRKDPVILNGRNGHVILNETKWSEESLGERSFADAQDDIKGRQDDDKGKEENRRQDDKIEYIDAKGGFVLPAFCDSHTHIVYAGCRDGEFRDKIAGLSYIFQTVAGIQGKLH